MAHMIETVNGKVQMAYAGETPWHGLGTKVLSDLTPDQMLEAAGLDWTVDKTPAFVFVKDQIVDTHKSALIRSTDDKILDIVSNDWNPVQNAEAFEFFNEFVAAGDMEMHTAGSLRGGQIVWGLAKIKESFELFKGDQIDSYLLFSNFHKYGFSTDVRFTPIRVVCNNTLTLSLSSKVERMVKISHRSTFNSDSVKSLLGVSSQRLAEYKDMAAFLGSKKAKNEDVIEYFTRIFPVTSASSANPKKEISKNAAIVQALLHSQPGSQYAEGTWWQPLNACTYLVDHIAGKTVDNRLSSAWYGTGRDTKIKALELAMEYANA